MCPCGLTAVAEVAGVVLRLVVDPHVVGDVRRRQQLPTDVTRHLLLVTDQVRTEAVPRGECRRARLKHEETRLQRSEGECFSVSKINAFGSSYSVENRGRRRRARRRRHFITTRSRGGGAMVALAPYINLQRPPII